MKTIVALFFFLISSAYASPVFQEKADFLCSQISNKSQFKYEDYFSPNVVAKIPYEYITNLFAEIFSDDGQCLSAKVIKSNGMNAKIKLYSKSTSQKFIISLDDKNLINGILFTGRSDPKKVINDQASLENELSHLPGVKSVYLQNYSSNQELLNINSKEKIALGSEFKLYILNLLSQKVLNGDLNWNDKFKTQENLKSLPSGKLQDYPAGTELSLKQYADLMISISDNTATDHLINFLGKKELEASMEGINSFIDQNTPFLTTMDLFRIRTLSTETVADYVSLPSNDKISFLKNLESSLNRNQVLEKLNTWEQPKDINLVEWFASTKDVCSVLEKLYNRSSADKTILDILSINAPFIWTEDDKNFEYIGYKGGSEPGVLTMTFLLKTRSQKWACLSLAVNSDKESLNDSEIMDLNHSILNYAGALLNN